MFTVAPARQQELVQLLVKATEEVMQHQPGFISANIHASADGERVVNYAQWENEHTEPRLHRVASVHHR